MAWYLIIDGGTAVLALTHALDGPDGGSYACGEARQDFAHGLSGPTRSWPTCRACRTALGLRTADQRAHDAGRAAAEAGRPAAACPYADLRTHDNRVTYSRALQNAWRRGFAESLRELAGAPS